MKSLQWKRFALVFSGIVLSTAFLWLALSKVDSLGLRTAFSSVRYVALIGCAVFLSIGVTLRSIRWRTIAGLAWDKQPQFFRATTMGLFSNLIFPVRAGEVVRVFTLAKLTDVSLSAPMASALIDRFVDLFVLLFSAIAIYLLSPIGELLGRWLTTMVIGTTVMVLFLALYARSSGFGEALLAKYLKRWLLRWPVKPELFLTEFRTELHHLIQGWFSLKLLGVVLFILIFDYAAFASLLYAFKLDLPPEAPFVLWVFLSASSALPSAPGYIGVYQLAAIWALSFFSVPASAAVAIATTLQLTLLAVATMLAGPGAWSMCKSALKNLKKIE